MDKNKTYEDYWLTTILGVLIVGLFVCVTVFIVSAIVKQRPIVEHHVYVCEKRDSLGDTTVYEKEAIDSLVMSVAAHDRDLAEKYQYAIEERSNEDYARSFIVIVVGVLISVLGFFGYKSFKDIKEHGKQISKDASEKEARLTVKRILPDMIKNEITREFEGQTVKTLEERLHNSLTIELQKYADNAINEQAKDIEKRFRDLIKDELFNKSDKEQAFCSEKNDTEFATDEDINKLFD